jgi:hypothetical protein
VVLQTGRIFEQIQDHEGKAQVSIQEGIAKAEKEEKIVTDEIAGP